MVITKIFVRISDVSHDHHQRAFLKCIFSPAEASFSNLNASKDCLYVFDKCDQKQTHILQKHFKKFLINHAICDLFEVTVQKHS